MKSSLEILEETPPVPNPVEPRPANDGDAPQTDWPGEPGPLGGQPEPFAGDELPPVADPPLDNPPPEKPQPVAESERHTSLDLLRGFALLGILLMNMLSFSWPDGAYGSATHLYYAPESIGEIPKPDKDKKENEEGETQKTPKPSYAEGEIRIAAVSSDADRAEWVLARLFAENKMRTLFSMLFGAGVLLMADHAAGKRISPAWLHYRRMFWMLLIGAAHAYFVWIGDILFGYACIGLAIYPMRWLSIRWLLRVGLFLFFLPLAMMWFVPNIVDWVYERGEVVAKEYDAAIEAKKAEKAAALQEAPKKESPKETQDSEATDGEAVSKPANTITLTKEEKEKLKPHWFDDLFRQGYQSMESMRKEGRKPESMTQAIREHRTQSYWGWFSERWQNILFMHLGFLFLGLLLMGWPMVLGMGLMKWGFFTGEWSTTAYARTAMILYAIGLPSEYTSIMVGLTPHHKPLYWEMRVTQPLENLAMLTLTLGNASFVLWLYKTGRLNWIAARLEAVGRMALSNYLFDSLFCTLLFSNLGPNLFASIPRVGLVGITVGIWLFQLWISPIWLRHFRFGPMEWLWRSLTYWKVQPLRRAAVRAA